MFRVPDSDDSLPSTPSHEKKSFFAPKSTTPAHDPPSYLTNVSTTPLGPPPRSVYGSSFNAGNNTFPRGRGSPLKSYTLPHSSPPREEDEDAEGEEDDEIGQSFISRGHRQSKSAFMSSAMSSPRGLKRSRSGKVQPGRTATYLGLREGLRNRQRQLSFVSLMILSSRARRLSADWKRSRNDSLRMSYTARWPQAPRG